MKRCPFEISNQGESIDSNFFKRLIRFENYYKNLIIEHDIYESNYKSVKMINTILQQDKLDNDDIKNEIIIYNSTNSKPHHEGTGWFDLRLHLRHLAFVYGNEYVTDKDFNLIEKKPDDNNALDGQSC